MKHRIYHITMRTPIGQRRGTMELSLRNDRVQGTLHLLAHSEPLAGSVDREGNCRIRGRLITLMRTIEYTAIGKITEKAVDLLLQGERNCFPITGTAIAEREDVT